MVPCQTSFRSLRVTNRDVVARIDKALSLLMVRRGKLSARSDICAQRVSVTDRSQCRGRSPLAIGSGIGGLPRHRSASLPKATLIYPVDRLAADPAMGSGRIPTCAAPIIGTCERAAVRRAFAILER